MKTSVSIATPSVPLPQMVFQGKLDVSLRSASELGYDGIELFVYSPEEVELKGLSELLRKYKLEAVLFSAFVSLSKQDITMGHLDASVRKRFLDLAPIHLEMAAALNAKVPIGSVGDTLSPASAKGISTAGFAIPSRNTIDWL